MTNKQIQPSTERTYILKYQKRNKYAHKPMKAKRDPDVSYFTRKRLQDSLSVQIKTH